MCQMTGKIKNLLNDKRTIFEEFCRRLTKIILLPTALPIYMYYAREQIYPRLSNYHQKKNPLKCICIVETSVEGIAVLVNHYHTCDIKIKSYSIFDVPTYLTVTCQRF